MTLVEKLQKKFDELNKTHQTLSTLVGLTDKTIDSVSERINMGMVSNLPEDSQQRLDDMIENQKRCEVRLETYNVMLEQLKHDIAVLEE